MNGESLLIGEIVTKFFNSLPVAVHKIVDRGATNKVFRVDLSESTIVIRISPEPNADQFQKEQWEMEQARQLQISTPKVLSVGMYENTPYMIQEFIGGVHGTEAPNKTGLWKTLGEYAKIIHSMPTKGFGDHMDMQFPGKFDSNRKDLSEYLKYNIDELNDKDILLKMDILTLRQSEKIKAMLESLKDESFTFGLNHGDLSLKNIIDKNGQVFLFDWGSSEVHIIPHFDFMEALQTSFKFKFEDRDFVAFINAYGFSENQFMEIKPTIDILFLLRAIDKLRWAIEKNHKADHFINILGEVLAYLEL